MFKKGSTEPVAINPQEAWEMHFQVNERSLDLDMFITSVSLSVCLSLPTSRHHGNSENPGEPNYNP